MPKKKILIVEDDGLESMDLQEKLQLWKYEVPAIANSGEKAIEDALETKPDLILMDILLKGEIDGIEAAEKIKDLEIPLVYITAYSDDKILKRASSTKPYNYVLKPFDERELKFTIEMALHRHEMERKLKESEKSLRLITDNMLDMVGWLDLEGIFRYVSPSAKLVIGCEREDILGKSAFDFIHDDDLEEVKQNFQKVISTLSPVRLPFRCKHGDGHYIWIETVNNPFFDDGQLKGIVFSAHDITDRKKMEKAIKDSGERYKTLVKTLPDAITTTDLDGNIIYASPRTVKLLGYKNSKELVGKSVFELLAPEDHKALENAIKEGSIKNLEQKFIKKDGSSFIGELNASLIKDSDGNPVAFIGTTRDITQRKKAEKELWKSKDLLEKTFKSLKDAVFIIDTKTVKIIDCNPAASTIFGYSYDEMLGRTTTFLHVDKAALEEFRKHLNYAVKDKGYLSSYEFRMKRKDGSIFPIEHSMMPLEDCDGKRMGWVSVVRDISHRKKMEEKIKASLKEKELLLQEIHHRTKNNLMIISSLLNLQSKYIKDEKTLNIFRESQNRAKSMALIHEKFYGSEDLGKIDFGEYIRNLAAELFHSYALDPKIKLNLNVEDIKLDINTAVPMGLIVNELISNCMKHAFPDEREGEIKIYLRTFGEKLMLTVSDNGIGFPEGLDYKKTESLGLQLVQNLVKQIEGKIEFERSPETTFKIIFEELKCNDR